MRSILTRSGTLIAVLVGFMVAGLLWSSAVAQRGVDRAVRQNFVAASLLARLQVEGEKMRRYEKEMFIYVAEDAKRTGYVKEFDAAYMKMLALLDAMLAPSSQAFDDAERAQILAWKQASIFYVNEFATLAQRAQALQFQSMTAEQRAGLTVQYNNDIKAGKDRFRELLSGADTLRGKKEESSQNIATEIQATFAQQRLGVLLGGLVMIAVVLLALRQPGNGHHRAENPRARRT
jgi:hypothetical protein